MRWLLPGLLALCLLLPARAPQAAAQSPSPPCTPPPGTSNLITCFGNTPCPSGYLDPLGLAWRNTHQNFADPSGTRWLCVQDPGTQGAGDSSGQAITAASAPSTGTTAPAAAVPAITTTLGLNTTAPLSPFLTDNQGMTLYIRTSDSSGVSTCNNACAIVWPPLPPPTGDATLPAGANGALATLTRGDGTLQLSYNGMPLYRYTGDFQPGDTNGQSLDATTSDGVSGVWKVAAP
jgi:predicted lipoprotein with Yx(FWY)xxD motif